MPANELENYAIALGTFVGLAAFVALGFRFGPLMGALRRRRGTQRASAIEVYLLSQLEGTLVPVGYAAALLVALATLHLAGNERHILRMLALAVGVWTLVRLSVGFFAFGVDRYVARNESVTPGGTNLRAFLPFVQVLLWGLGLVVVLDDWGFHVSAIITGLGIGGVAVALAAQSILRDWFGYLAIVADRPFELGQLVAIGPEYVGIVSGIGVRSVRLRSVSGEELTLPNADVAAARIRNFARMDERRVVFTFIVSRDTPTAKLQSIPAMVRDAVTAATLTRFDRSHWLSFVDAGFVFENVYFVLSPDQTTYMDRQQQINLAIADALHGQRILLTGAPPP